MSANLLRQPGKLHTLTDDLESFLHVLGWMTLRYVPADGYLDFHRGMDLVMFDEYYQDSGLRGPGGHLKFRALLAGRYPSRTFEPRCETPLFNLLLELGKPFKSLYGEPPEAQDREKISIPNSQDDQDLEDLSRDIRRYNRDIEHLQASTWFVNEIQEFINREDWPADDKADENLPTAFSVEERRQISSIMKRQFANPFSRIQIPNC